MSLKPAHQHSGKNDNSSGIMLSRSASSYPVHSKHRSISRNALGSKIPVSEFVGFPLTEELRTALELPVVGDELDKLIENLIGEIELRNHELFDRERLRQSVQQFLASHFPIGQTFMCGSSENKLGFLGCDVDMFALLGYDPWEGGTPAQQASRASHLAWFLAREITRAKLGIQIQVIPRARTPVVKFQDTLFGLHVDLSFKHGLSYYNTKLIKQYCETHQLVRPVLMTIRYWAKIQGLTNGSQPSTHLTNYALNLLVLFVLMARKEQIIPSVAELKTQVSSDDLYQASFVVGGWNCSFGHDVSTWKKKSHKVSCMELITEFFKYYGEFDAANYMICPLLGEMIAPSTLKEENIDILHVCLKYYFLQKEKLKVDTPLIIQDPFEHNSNVTSGLKEIPLNVFQFKCRVANSLCADIVKGEKPLGDLFKKIDINPKKNLNYSSPEEKAMEESEVEVIEPKITESDEVKKDRAAAWDQYSFSMNFKNCPTFSVQTSGEIDGNKIIMEDGELIAKTACDIVHFCLLQLLKVKIKQVLFEDNSLKRKIDDDEELDNSESNKKQKTSNGCGRPVMSKYQKVAMFHCVADKQLWIGHKKVARTVSEGSFETNPLEREISVANLQLVDHKDAQLNFRFQVYVWQMRDNPFIVFISGVSLVNMKNTRQHMFPMFNFLKDRTMAVRTIMSNWASKNPHNTE